MSQENNQPSEAERRTRALVKSELDDFIKRPFPGFSLRCSPIGDVLILECSIPGKIGSDWAKGQYRVILNFTGKSYPFQPPDCLFQTGFFHVMVNPENGHAHLPILQNDKWRPNMRIKDIITYLYEFLPFQESYLLCPKNTTASQMAESNRVEFNNRIVEQAKVHRPPKWLILEEDNWRKGIMLTHISSPIHPNHNHDNLCMFLDLSYPFSTILILPYGKAPLPGFYAGVPYPCGGEIHWQFGVPGHPDTVWEGGVYMMTIQFPADYPKKWTKCVYALSGS